MWFWPPHLSHFLSVPSISFLKSRKSGKTNLFKNPMFLSFDKDLLSTFCVLYPVLGPGGYHGKQDGLSPVLRACERSVLCERSAGAPSRVWEGLGWFPEGWYLTWDLKNDEEWAVTEELGGGVGKGGMSQAEHPRSTTLLRFFSHHALQYG